MYQYLLDFLGTLFFMYIVLATGNPLAMGAAFALTMMLTGTYLNPAITIVMAAAGQMGTSEVIPYLVAEILGGLTALEIFKRVRL